MEERSKVGEGGGAGVLGEFKKNIQCLASVVESVNSSCEQNSVHG